MTSTKHCQNPPLSPANGLEVVVKAAGANAETLLVLPIADRVAKPAVGPVDLGVAPGAEGVGRHVAFIRLPKGGHKRDVTGKRAGRVLVRCVWNRKQGVRKKKGREFGAIIIDAQEVDPAKQTINFPTLACSKSIEARPLLSPETRWLVLCIEAVSWATG